MSDFLRDMAKSSAARAAQARAFTDADFDKPVVPLTLGTFDLIAEIKNRSPAEGQLRDQLPISDFNVHLAARANAYAGGGAAAISVLTEPSRFDGELSHLEAVVAAAPSTPVMRKDFLVEPVQVLEARAAGASGVLLITTMRTTYAAPQATLIATASC
jgi:indole-3-glycerol phosphate synthase